MYIYPKKALRKSKCHHTGNVIEAGETFLQVSNGTIGKGCRTFNISFKASLELIGEISNLNDKFHCENVIEFKRPEIVEYVHDYTIESDKLFTYDDIPF